MRGRESRRVVDKSWNMSDGNITVLPCYCHIKDIRIVVHRQPRVLEHHILLSPSFPLSAHQLPTCAGRQSLTIISTKMFWSPSSATDSRTARSRLKHVQQAPLTSHLTNHHTDHIMIEPGGTLWILASTGVDQGTHSACFHLGFSVITDKMAIYLHRRREN